MHMKALLGLVLISGITGGSIVFNRDSFRTLLNIRDWSCDSIRLFSDNLTDVTLAVDCFKVRYSIASEVS